MLAFVSLQVVVLRLVGIKLVYLVFASIVKWFIWGRIFYGLVINWGKLFVAGSHKLTGLYGFFGNTLLSVLFTTHAAIGLIKPNAVSF